MFSEYRLVWVWAVWTFLFATSCGWWLEKGGKGKKSGGQRQTRNAFTIKVKDVDGSDEVHQEVHVTVNKELISTILGLQAGTVEKLADAGDAAELSDKKAKA